MLFIDRNSRASTTILVVDSMSGGHRHNICSQEFYNAVCRHVTEIIMPWVGIMIEFLDVLGVKRNPPNWTCRPEDT